MSSTPPPPPTPSFHAELLSNIRSITLSISLPTPCTSTTTLTLTSPTLLELVHDGITTPLPLPAAAAQTVLKATPGARALSYRLPVATVAPQQQQQQQAENYVPWSASDLENAAAGKSVSLMCKACSCVVLDGKVIGKWKDLPSGNWAEMMEFWHCHKPGPEKKTNGVSNGINGASNNANGANGTSNGTNAADDTSKSTHAATTANGDGSKYRGLQGGFKAEPGTILVDLTYFLVAPTDCESVQVVEAPYANTLICSNCKCHLGSTDPATHSHTLNKWKLTLSLSAHGIRSEYSYPLEPFLVAQLLALAEGEGTRRMLISTSTPAPTSPLPASPTTTNSSGASTASTASTASAASATSEKKLKLWVFSADVRYTSSKVSRPLRAVKVFYQDCKEEEQQRQEKKQQQGTSLGNNGFEEVRLQREMVVGLKQKLEEGVDAVDGFGGWNVGYLMRFEKENRAPM